MKCPQCGSPELRKQLNIIVDVPVEWRAYHKSALQSAGIDIMGVDRNYLMMYCTSCGWSKETRNLETSTLKISEGA